jgi:hypothetical protein
MRERLREKKTPTRVATIICNNNLIIVDKKDIGLIDEHTEVQDFLAKYWFDLTALQ